MRYQEKKIKIISKLFQAVFVAVYVFFLKGLDFLSHHFAWSNLNRWAAEGLDLNVMLPYLMRYMGHQSVSGTLYYFHFVPEFFPTYKSMTDALEDVIPEVSYEE